MAITINGNGTFTGVSVGGLPDGIVDTDMLAAKAATAPKLGDGTLIQAKCSASSNAGQISSTSNSYEDVTGIDLVITPLSSNSTMILVTSFHVSTAAGNRNASVRLTFDHSGINQTAIDTNQDGYSVNSEGGSFDGWGTMCYTHSPNTTNEITYRFQFRNVGPSSTVYMNRKPSKIIAYEVAA